MLTGSPFLGQPWSPRRRTFSVAPSDARSTLRACMNNRPYPPNSNNVPGPFYVEDGCCTACGIPESAAPEHFTYDESGQCYVRKQPCTLQKTDRMLQAMWGAELDCIRYRGHGSDVFQRLGPMGKPHLCDFPLLRHSSHSKESCGFRERRRKLRCSRRGCWGFPVLLDARRSCWGFPVASATHNARAAQVLLVRHDVVRIRME